MRANSARCEWGPIVLAYLGYLVGLGKIKVPEARVKAIRIQKALHPEGFVPDYAGRTGLGHCTML